ncbi:MAG: hypothetical protein ACR2PG_21135, partial [Hyphomicrobiaceae bacterium]
MEFCVLAMTIGKTSTRRNYVDVGSSGSGTPTLSPRGQLPAIDLAHLERVTGGDKELQSELLKMFGEQLVEAIA